jgi:hypothetical protein
MACAARDVCRHFFVNVRRGTRIANRKFFGFLIPQPAVVLSTRQPGLKVRFA